MRHPPGDVRHTAGLDAPGVIFSDTFEPFCLRMARAKRGNVTAALETGWYWFHYKTFRSFQFFGWSSTLPYSNAANQIEIHNLINSQSLPLHRCTLYISVPKVSTTNPFQIYHSTLNPVTNQLNHPSRVPIPSPNKSLGLGSRSSTPLATPRASGVLRPDAAAMLLGKDQQSSRMGTTKCYYSDIPTININGYNNSFASLTWSNKKLALSEKIRKTLVEPCQQDQPPWHGIPSGSTWQWKMHLW